MLVWVTATALERNWRKPLNLHPGHFAARLALARLLLLEGQKEEFNEQLAVLNELSPDHPDVLRLKAALAQAQGDQENGNRTTGGCV